MPLGPGEVDVFNHPSIPVKGFNFLKCPVPVCLGIMPNRTPGGSNWLVNMFELDLHPDSEII